MTTALVNSLAFAIRRAPVNVTYGHVGAFDSTRGMLNIKEGTAAIAEGFLIGLTCTGMTMPQDETATWKHRCSEKLLLAHVMQLIKPDEMH